MTPMLLDDAAGCPGRRSLIRASRLGICIACDRLDKPGDSIQPRAQFDSALGRWHCPDRRYTAPHVPDRAPVAAGPQSLAVGASSHPHGG